jgi:hypothetical protein
VLQSYRANRQPPARSARRAKQQTRLHLSLAIVYRDETPPCRQLRPPMRLPPRALQCHLRPVRRLLCRRLPLPPPSTFDVLPDLHKLLKRLLETSPTPTTTAQPSADGPLEIQHVATAATDIKLKIQKAQRAVMSLPDIDRTCEDQQEEIEDLKARIAGLKASLRELGRPTEEASDRDQRMTG